MYLADLNLTLSDSGGTLSSNAVPADTRPGLAARLTASRPTAWASTVITLSLLAAVLWQLRGLQPAEIVAQIPGKPEFWVVFAIWYATPPVADWIIFRRLWRVPADGLIALARKFVGNELVLGYIGEAYFYAWARTRTDLTSAPFGAIKDVAILSALVGNAITVLMLAAAYPALGSLHLGIGGRAFAISVAVVLVSSVVPMLLRRRLFGLSRPNLRFVSAVHFGRVTLMTLLAALMWHIVLPGQPLELWVMLAALRLLLSRLPLMPNKDLVFAGLAVLVMGHDVEVATMMAMLASLTLVTHAITGLALIASDMAGWERR